MSETRYPILGYSNIGYSIPFMSTIHKKEYRVMIEKLVMARKEAGLTQLDVAKKFGVHQSFISKIETCQRRVDVLELKEFVKIYGVELGNIL